jgi:hypothetical protein
MDTAPPLLETEPAPPPAPTAADLQRREEFLIAALKTAIAEPKEHRLFQSGKLPGLFPTRTGLSSEAALDAIKRGYFESVRTETKGKFIVEWVRATPRGVECVHKHDSPKAVLHELKTILATSRAGLPGWLVDTRDELDAISAKFEDRAREVIGKLDELSRRLDVALRRVEAQGPDVPAAISQLVPWAVDALEYLDRRTLAGAPNPCPLGELFAALRDKRPGISIPEFHTGLRRLHDNRAGRLIARKERAADAEYALLVGQELCSFIER